MKIDAKQISAALALIMAKHSFAGSVDSEVPKTYQIDLTNGNKLEIQSKDLQDAIQEVGGVELVEPFNVEFHEEQKTIDITDVYSRTVSVPVRNLHNLPPNIVGI